MRGALQVGLERGHALRIIPAYAGSTIVLNSYTQSGRDHPRVCGEHSASAVSVSAAQGSSPRMRGAQGVGHVLGGEGGIIPAYAGSTIGGTLD